MSQCRWSLLNQKSDCSGSCIKTFDTSRFAFDDRGSIHMLQLVNGDIPDNFDIICDARVASVKIQQVAWRTSYTLPQPPVSGGSASTSATATLRYVSGATSISGTTATGTLTVMEGQQAVLLACIYSDKNSLISVTFSKVGTGFLVRHGVDFSDFNLIMDIFLCAAVYSVFNSITFVV